MTDRKDSIQKDSIAAGLLLKHELIGDYYANLAAHKKMLVEAAFKPVIDAMTEIAESGLQYSADGTSAPVNVPIPSCTDRYHITFKSRTRENDNPVLGITTRFAQSDEVPIIFVVSLRNGGCGPHYLMNSLSISSNHIHEWQYENPYDALDRFIERLYIAVASLEWLKAVDAEKLEGPDHSGESGQLRAKQRVLELKSRIR